jgi:2-dehydro-3-deoxyphosphogluconate aldolase/(4S)-4-hydroxy-2-oxoglutarate aldolase
MTKEQIRDRIQEIGIIPAIRVSNAEDALFAAEAVCESGIPIVEVTMTVSGAVKVIQEITRNKPDVIVGAGTLFDLDSARRCLDAGASFLTSPGLDLEIVEFARRHQVVVFPGALTPTEIMSAWKAGSDFVKV